jgi:hypothetical protein
MAESFPGRSVVVVSQISGSGRRRIWQLPGALFSKQTNDIVECLFHIDAAFGRGLDKLTAQLLCQRMTLLCGYFSLGDSVTFVAHQHDWHRCSRRRERCRRAQGRAGVAGAARRLLDSIDLVMKSLDAGKGGARGDAVHQHKAFSITDPLVSECCVFFLPRRVQDFQHARMAVDDDLLPVRVFNGGIVGFDKVV